MAEKFEKEIPVDKGIESKIEKAVEDEEVVTDNEEKLEKPKLDNTTVGKKAVPLDYKDEQMVIIKSILSEDVNELYAKLDTFRKHAFRKRGEEISLKIKVILQRTKVRANEIFELIKNWLQLLPGINNYFLDQEAKIKTDKLLAMKKEDQIIEK